MAKITFKQFLDLVEIKVVIPSISPAIVGALYSIWQYGRINWLNTVLLLLAAVFAQLAVNTYNRYEDNKRQASNDYLRDQAVGEQINDRQVLHVAIGLGVLASIAGILVALNTSWITWMLGLLSFLIGYLYSAGPFPITNTPFGELFSGVTMGYVIFLSMVYVNTQLSLDFVTLGRLFMIALPLTLAVANVMFANNIADFGEDQANHRNTLVYYLGYETSKKIFVASHSAIFALIGLAILMSWLPMTVAFSFLLVPLVVSNTKRFINQPIKAVNFILVIKNLVILTLGLVVGLAMGIVFY